MALQSEAVLQFLALLLVWLSRVGRTIVESFRERITCLNNAPGCEVLGESNDSVEQ